MAGFTDLTERSLLDHFFTDPTYTPPATMYIGLSTTTPTEAGTNFTEPSTGSYARVATTAADWGPAAGTAPATKSNTTAKSFPTATADWSAGAPMTFYGLWSASSAGTLLAFGAMTTPKPVLSGDTPAFAVGALVVKLGDPTDVY